ncbi:MAG TPA: hypothetical protein VFU00_03135 [Gemmatimonadales bacterium]|nr:hypothetical protein [Gemmatimonadales bacterium]
MHLSRTATAHALIAERFPETLPAAQRTRSAVATGIAALDRIFPAGGFQRGRLAVWTPGIGAAALLRSACLHTVTEGERAVWIDGERVVAGACWRNGPLLVRPRGALEALRAAEVLARSGGFALLVLDGTEPESAAMVRLSRAAHEGGTALVLLTPVTALATIRLASRARLEQYRWRRNRHGPTADLLAVHLTVEARASGWHAGTELTLPVWRDDLRLSLEPGRRDRRGER